MATSALVWNALAAETVIVPNFLKAAHKAQMVGDGESESTQRKFINTCAILYNILWLWQLIYGIITFRTMILYEKPQLLR